MNQTGYRTNTVNEAIRHQNHTHERTDIGGFGLAVSGTETAEERRRRPMGARAIRMKSMRKPRARRPHVAYRTSGGVGPPDGAPHVYDGRAGGAPQVNEGPSGPSGLSGPSDGVPQVKGAFSPGSGHGVPSRPPGIVPTVDGAR